MSAGFRSWELGPEMGFEYLEINRLTDAGVSQRRVRCLARHITVFRARDGKELESYSLALQGITTKERFSLLLDGLAFKPEDHNFIGFGGAKPLNDNITVSDSLTDSGYTPEGVESLLLSTGLGGLGSTNLSALSESQSHTLRLLVAIAEAHKVLVLNDPFEPIPSEWRDKVAELLLDFAWNKMGIVVITKLSYRPPSWIENEIISRVQLERPRQATIGFGGASDEALLIQKLREELKAEGLAPTPPQPGLSAALSRPRRNWEEYLVSKNAILSYCAVICICLGLIAWGMGSIVNLARPRDVVLLAGMEPRENGAPIIDAGAAESSKVLSTSPSQHSVQPVDLTPGTPLDRYPAAIREAVIESFERPEEVIQSWYRSAKLNPIAPRPVNVVASREQSFDSDVEVSTEEESEEDESELEARREEIRKKFLEAIQAAG